MRQSSHKLLVSDSRRLDAIADESIALVITSPPYPMIAMWDESFSLQSDAVQSALSDGDHPAAFEAMHQLLDPVWQECCRVLIPGGFVCVNIGDAVRSDVHQFRLHPNHSRIVGALANLGFTLLPSIVWRKPANSPTKFMGSGMLPGGAYVTLEHEHILIGRKGKPRKPSTVQERELRRESALFWEERNEWYSDLWSLPGVRQSLVPADATVRSRSAAFPFALPYRIVSMYSWIGDTVLDPFGGTGTTALAAASLARNSVTIDADASMIAVARAAFQSESTTANLQEWTKARIDRHREFASERGSSMARPLRHQNELYGFSVVTGQETDLRLPYLTAVIVDGDQYRCRYSDVPGSQAVAIVDQSES